MLLPINLTGQSYTSRSKPLSAQVCRNFYPEPQNDAAAFSKFALMPFPGYSLFSSTIPNITALTYSTSLDLSSQITAANTGEGMKFGDSGSKLYILVGGAQDSVFQYNLSTAYDISTASYASKSFSVNTQDSDPQGLAFNDDGTKMYMAGNFNDAIYQYTLSTAWDVSTASYDSVSLDISSQALIAEGIAWGDSGLKLYVVNNLSGNKTIYQYTVTTAYDLSTASYASKSLDVSTESSNPKSMAFFNNGASFLLAHGAPSPSANIFEYSLSTAWDISTASYTGTSFTLTEDTPIGLQVTSTKFWIHGYANRHVYEYTTTQTSTTNRGLFEHQGTMYIVYGTNLYSVDSAGTQTSLGTILGSGQCIFAGIDTNVVICSETHAYVWDGSTVTEITDVDLETPTGCAYLNDQIIFDGNNGRFCTSDVGDATSINSLNYATAESNADNLLRPYVMGQVLYLMGDRTIEQWWNSGSGNPPFDRIEGGIIQVGLRAAYSVADNGDAMYFLGDDLRVWAVSGSTKKIISKTAISNAIEGYTTTTDAIGTYFTFQGQGFYL